MTTRAISKRAHIRVERAETRGISAPLAIVFIIFSIVLVVGFFFLTGAYEEAREQFMEGLKKEKRIVETNKSLKMELFAITQKGYLEFAAQERLGLKRAKDEEVVVLR